MSRISYRPIVKKFKDGNDHYISGELLLELAFERIRKIIRLFRPQKCHHQIIKMALIKRIYKLCMM